MRASIVAVLLIAIAGCDAEEPRVATPMTLAELRDTLLDLHSAEWLYSPDEEAPRRVILTVAIGTSSFANDQCPLLPESLYATLNGAPVEEVRRGGYRDGFCSPAGFVSSNLTGPSLDVTAVRVEIGDESMTMTAAFDDVLTWRTAALDEPGIGPLDVGARMRVLWEPDDLSMSDPAARRAIQMKRLLPSEAEYVDPATITVEGHHLDFTIPDGTWTGDLEFDVVAGDLKPPATACTGVPECRATVELHAIIERPFVPAP